MVNSSLFSHMRVTFSTGESVTGRIDSESLEVCCPETGEMSVSQVSLLKRGAGVRAEVVIEREQLQYKDHHKWLVVPLTQNEVSLQFEPSVIQHEQTLIRIHQQVHDPSFSLQSMNHMDILSRTEQPSYTEYLCSFSQKGNFSL